VTELLKKQGYQTGHFGKWHIGPEEKNGTYGIDVVGGDKTEGRRQRKGEPERGRDAHIYDDAIKFIEEHKGGPFYLDVWSHVSHHPVDPPQSYVDKFKDVVVDESQFPEPMRAKFERCRKSGGDVNDCMRRFMADVFSMDEDIGRLLKRLDELGLRENTIVVFSSDQGAADIREPAVEGVAKGRKKANPNRDESVRLNAMGYNGGFRGGKFAMYEGGVRVPFIVRWPGHVPAGRSDEKSVISGIDWLPTLCHLAGAQIDAKSFEGEDVSATWLGQQDHVRAKPLFWKTSNPGSPAGIREGQWKLIDPVRPHGGELELYDIVADPFEQHNVIDQHPEVVKGLKTKLEAWVSTLPKAYLKTQDKDN
jgi:N-acetylgalactosamine-6-sulfatase